MNILILIFLLLIIIINQSLFISCNQSPISRPIHIKRKKSTNSSSSSSSSNSVLALLPVFITPTSGIRLQSIGLRHFNIYEKLKTLKLFVTAMMVL